jgi:hypothetical protein
MSVKIFLKNFGKEVEVPFVELKNLLHNRLISGEDYVKAVKAQAEKAFPGWETKAQQDVAVAEADAKKVEDAIKSDAKKAEADVAAAVKTAEDDAAKVGRTQPAHEVKPADAVTEPSSDNSKKDGA